MGQPSPKLLLAPSASSGAAEKADSDLLVAQVLLHGLGEDTSQQVLPVEYLQAGRMPFQAMLLASVYAFPSAGLKIRVTFGPNRDKLGTIIRFLGGTQWCALLEGHPPKSASLRREHFVLFPKEIATPANAELVVTSHSQFYKPGYRSSAHDILSSSTTFTMD